MSASVNVVLKCLPIASFGFNKRKEKKVTLVSIQNTLNVIQIDEESAVCSCTTFPRYAVIVTQETHEELAKVKKLHDINFLLAQFQQQKLFFFYYFLIPSPDNRRKGGSSKSTANKRIHSLELCSRISSSIIYSCYILL